VSRKWGEVFGDDVVAAAMIDRLVHHAEVVALKRDLLRLKDRDLRRVPATGNAGLRDQDGAIFRPSIRGQSSAVVDSIAP